MIGYTNRQNTEITTLYINKFGNPALSGYKVFFERVNLFNKELLNHAKNLPVVLTSSSVKIWGKSLKGFQSYDQTYKQTTEFNTLYIYRYSTLF